MFVRRTNMIPHEYNWNHSFINQLLIAILLLTSSLEILANNINLMEDRSSQKINCMIYKSCKQCNDVSICNWLIEKQICLYSNQSRSGESIVDTKQSCPEFAVTYDRYQIQVKVLNIAVDSVNTFFNKRANIVCEIENKNYKALIDNGVIICKHMKNEILLPEKQSINGTNALYIFYFSIVFNNVRLQFNDPRDHYISYHDRTCPNEDCTIRFWESDLRKYYCKWCLKNDSCKITGEQLNSCKVWNSIINHFPRIDHIPQSTIEVKNLDVVIESFKPDVILYNREMPTVVTITIKDLHWILANGRLNTVTVAGKSCDNLTTFDGQTVNCNITTDSVANEGPVVIEYTWMEKVVRLNSTQNFRFVEPSFTAVSPLCLPASGGGRIELTGQYLNTTPDIQVLFINMTKSICEIVALSHDRISCVTNAKPDGPNVGKMQIVFENWFGKFYKDTKMVTFVSDPTVADGQIFEGIASGNIPLTVQGNFKCTDKQQMYVVYNETRFYGHCAPRNTNDAVLMDCWPPKFDDVVQMVSLPLGFHVDLAGKVVYLPQQTMYRYLLYPDPVYTGFEVYNRTVVRVDGVFPKLLQRRRDDGNYMFEVTFHDDKMDYDDTFIVTDVTENYIECLSPADTSVVDVLEIGIAVGKQVKRTVVHRRHKQYYAMVRLLSPQYVIGGISSLLICIFALIFCVKKISYNSKQQMNRRYIEELRNITAGIDNTTDYLLNSPARS